MTAAPRIPSRIRRSKGIESNIVQASAPYQVGPDTVVHFSYRLFDAEGEWVEGSDESVLSFLFGYGQIAPGLEAALEGLAPGAHRTITLEPEEAFGARDPDQIIEIERDELPEDAQPGDEYVAEHEDGDAVTLLVLEVQDDRAVVDANHPLSGQRITLELRVEAVRPALSGEIDEARTLLEETPLAAPSLLPAASLLRRPT